MDELFLTLKKEWDTLPNRTSPQAHFVGREKEIERLISDIVRKSRGSFLISGDRGVGKTAFVYKVLQEVEGDSEKNISVLLNAPHLGNKQDGEDDDKFQLSILHDLIRRFYLTIKNSEINIGEELTSEVNQLIRIVLAYKLKSTEKGEFETQDEYEEKKIRKWNLEISEERLVLIAKTLVTSGVFFALLDPVLTYFEVPNNILSAAKSSFISVFSFVSAFAVYGLKIENEKTRIIKNAEKKSIDEFCEIDHKSVGNLEFKFTNVIEHLSREGYTIVFVIDELDKITPPSKVIEIVKSFKNLFTLSSVTFIFITGKEIYDIIIDSSRVKRRPIEYTIFNQRILLPRPNFREIEEFLDGVIDDMTPEIRESSTYRDFRNYICFEAKTDFFDLYNYIRDHIHEIDEDCCPIIRLPKLNKTQLLKSRFQKALGQTFDVYKYDSPSDNWKNEELLDSLYSFVDTILSHEVSYTFLSITEDDRWVHAHAKNFLCMYLARLGALNEHDKPEERESILIEEKSITPIEYTWLEECDEVLSSPDIRTEFEDKFVQKVRDIRDLMLDMANTYRKIVGKRIFDKGGFPNNAERMIDTITPLIGGDSSLKEELIERYLPIYDSITGRITEHAYNQSVLEKHTTDLDKLINRLEEPDKLWNFMETIMKEVLKDFSSAALQNNPQLFSEIPELRERIINENPKYNVLFNPDMSKQVLITMDIPPPILEGTGESLYENSKKLKVVNLQLISEDIHYNLERQKLDYRSVFWNIKWYGNFDLFYKYITNLEKWAKVI